jgi:hypothetical protein
MDTKRFYHLLEDLVWVGQLGLSLVLPPVLCLLGCWWLTRHTAAGVWVYLPGLVLGVGAAVVTFKSFWKMMLQRAKKDGDDHPVSFNKH